MLIWLRSATACESVSVRDELVAHSAALVINEADQRCVVVLRLDLNELRLAPAVSNNCQIDVLPERSHSRLKLAALVLTYSH